MTLHEDLANQLEIQSRYVMATPLAEGKRVLDMGGHSLAGLTQLVQAGADEIAVLHADPAALTAALDEAGVSGLDVAPDAPGSLPFDDGAFDLIICHDIAERLQARSIDADELRRVLAPDGFLMVAIANPQGQFLGELAGVRGDSALRYEQVADAIGPKFAALTVLGQSPLTGSLFFDFADSSDDTGLSLDRSLLPDEDEQAGWYILILGPHMRPREDLALVQLPFAMAVQASQARRPQAAPSTADEGAMQRLVAHHQAQIEQLQEELAVAERQLRQSPAVGGGGSETLPLAEREQALNARLVDLEAHASLHGLQQELERARHDKASYESQINDLLAEVRVLRQRDDSQQEQLQAMQKQADAAQKTRHDPQAAQLRQELENLQIELQAAAQSRMVLESELTQLRSAVPAHAQPVASRPRDAVGRVLETSVEELEDLLKDVAPPVSSGR